VGEDTNQIEQEIRERRSDLGRNLNELEDKARQLADWRTHYREHPKVFLGAAIGAGIVLALATVSKARPSVRAFDSDDAEALPERDTTHDVYRFSSPPNPARRTVNRIQREVGDTWNHIANGLLSLASAKAIQLVSELVPGFSDHVEPPQRPVSKTLH
jgi:hypothetical protein